MNELEKHMHEPWLFFLIRAFHRSWPGVAMTFLVVVLTPSARGELSFELLYGFEQLPSGPYSALIEAQDGNFYGTTLGGGTSGRGTVFRLTPSGELTTLHSFTGPDGEYSSAPLLEGSDGNFYGTTQFGGTSDRGTVFKLTPSGELTTLHRFTGPDGENPLAALIESSDGNFYGTTEEGGAAEAGTVFKVDASAAETRISCRPVHEKSEDLGISSDLAIRLKESAYGVVDAPRRRFQRFSRDMLGFGFKPNRLEPCAWTYFHEGKQVAYVSTSTI